MFNKGLIIKSIIGLFVVIMFFSSFEIINEGERGLLFTFGSISDKEIKPGLTFKIPIIQSIQSYTVRPIEVISKVEVGPQGAISKDNQTIGANLTTYYKYKEGELVTMYSKFGESKIKEILNNTIMESFKSVIGAFDIFSLPINQTLISKQVFDLVKSKVSSYPIDVTEIKITNYDWSDAFDAQIEETMKQAQRVKQKEKDLLITEQEAQKKVKQAEADRAALVQQAEGEKEAAALRADAKKLEGEGIKAYNEAIRTNLDMELSFRKLEIEKIKAEKWNGQYVPTNNYGPIPIQSGSLQGK